MFSFSRILIAVVVGLTSVLSFQASAEEIYLSPAGDDSKPGTSTKPLASLAAAQKLTRTFAGKEPVTVLLADGTYYLPATLQFTAADSGTENFPVTYTAAPGAHPVISGGVRLKLEWTPYRDGIFQAHTPPGLVWDQLFVNGERQHMARYPNYNPQAGQFGGSAADAISPERVARWADPAGGFIHAMHSALWGDMHYRILGKNPDGSLRYEGGWQNNRPSAMHPQYRFVENIFEELDAPGEWFHNEKTSTLFFMPPPGLDLKTAVIEVVQLAHLVEFNGLPEKPVKYVTLRGLTFRHATRTFMENREPILRSDWTVYRGGAVFFNGAEDCSIADCDFDQLGGNAIFVSDYNRRITVRGCLVQDSGANGVSFVGDPQAVRSPLFNYGAQFDYAKLDRTPGPIGNNFPADCLVEDCLITRSGRFEKQTAPVEIDMAQNITVRHCSIYDVPRAGINIGDGCWGGHVIEFCDIFDTVLETGDHGSFNSWGRDRYWHPDGKTVEKQVAADPQLPFLDVVAPITLRNNRWRCDHGWDIDLDDGSSNYRIYNNLLLHGGLKLREGFGRIATNNIIVNNSLHPHVWFAQSGDVFARNIVMGAYRPALMEIPKWGAEVDFNLFTTSSADRQKFVAKGCDAHSLVGDAQFVNPAAGDFRVKATSPALKLGFVNFPMDQFGVQSPRLKAIARTPEITLPVGSGLVATVAQTNWLGATLRELAGEEYSALGLAADARGVLVAQAPKESAAFHAGLQAGDFIEQANGQPVKNLAGFLAATANVTADQTLKLELIRRYQPKTIDFPAAESAGFIARQKQADAEVARLLPQMTLEEKLLQLLAYRPNGVARLGIPNLQAGEALHGVVSDGCTSFPQSIALGATFDPQLVEEVASVIAQESRAVGVAQIYAPMLATARDPRWGRVEESYGEDPLLVSRMAVAYIKGAQGEGDARFANEKVITTPKHFVADGEPWAGANGEGFETSERTLREIHLQPFEAAVKLAHTGSIMPAHHALNGVPCHANSWLLDTLLRKEWGFDGFVTSDMGDIPKLGTGGGYGGYRFVRDDFESAVASLNAGVDMELVGNLYMADLLRAVKEGEVSEATVSRAAERVLRAKILLLGLGEPKKSSEPVVANTNPTAEVIGNYQGKDDIWARLIAEGKFSTPESGRRPNWKQIVNASAHDELALHTAQRAIVLLKNENNLLPLDKSKLKKMLVVGPVTKTMNLGGYSTGKPKFYVNVVDGLKAIGGGGVEVNYAPGCAMMPQQKWGSKDAKPKSPTDLAAHAETLLADAKRAASNADVIVVVVGHTRDQLGENLDRDTLDLPGGQEALVEAMQATGKPVVVVVNGGNVHSINWIQDHVPAIVQAFYLGQAAGTALAQVLFGEVNPGGKMPLTTPRNVGQVPCYYNHPPFTGPVNYYGSPSGPLYPFGHGLSYTTFKYSNLKVSGPISRDTAAQVSVTIENSGTRAGDEVVQLYLRQDYTSVTRPVKALAGFQRVTLQSGEKCEVTFPVGFEQVKFWKAGGWVAEPGEIHLMVGSSSADIRLQGELESKIQ